MKRLFALMLSVLFVPFMLFAGNSRQPAQPFTDGKADRPVFYAGTTRLAQAPVTTSNATIPLSSGGSWLRSQQAASGGFPWSIGDVPQGNVQGPAGYGILSAYQYTGTPEFQTSAIANGNFLVPNYPRLFSDNDPRFATFDAYFLEMLSAATGNASYAAFVQTNYWDKLNSGTYGETNDMDAAEYGSAIIAGRAGIVELVPWDLGGVAIGAQAAGENGVKAAIMAKVLDALNATTTSTNSYDMIGLAGAVWASAVTGIDLDPTAGMYAADNSTADLAARLAALQQSNGAWMWSATNPACVATDPTNFDTQVTAFAVLALNAINRAQYLPQITAGAGFLLSMQQPDGQILIYPGAAPTAMGGVETHAEATTALVAARPADVFVDDNWAGSTGGQVVASGKVFGFNAFASVGDGHGAVMANGLVDVAAGTYPVAVNLQMNKAGITLKGAGSAQTTVTVSGTGYRFSVSASGVTIKDLAIQKTDKTGVQDIIWMNADNFTLKNCVVSGQFVIGEGDVSRAIATSGGHSGMLIEGNTFYSLRQPMYVTGPVTGLIKNNFTYSTKGWVLEGGDVTFTGNTWGSGAGVNVYDIAILSVAPATAYTDIVAMSNANTEAVIEDQRVSPAVLSVSYVDKNTAFSGDMGGKYHPYATIAPAITRVVTGGKIYVAGGSYNENIVVDKLLTMDGAGSGSDPASATIIHSVAATTPVLQITASGVNATTRLTVKDIRVTGATGGENPGAGILVQSPMPSGYYTFSNIVATGNQGSGIAFNSTASVTDVQILNSTLSNNNFGLRIASATPSFIGLTVTDCQMNDNTSSAFTYNPNGVVANVGTGFTFTNTTFSGNSSAGVANQHDLSFFGFHGNASLTNVTVASANGPSVTHKAHGIAFTNAGTFAPAGSIVLNGVTCTGTVGKSAITFQAYSDVSAVALTNVDVKDVVAPWGQLTIESTGSTPMNLGNIALKSMALWASGGATATAASFYHITSGTLLNRTLPADLAQIEAQVGHKPDNALLGIVDYGQMAGSYSEIWVDDSWTGTPTGTPVSGHWFGANAFATIQEAVNAVVVPGTINVAAGAYAEEVTVGKSQLVIRKLGAGVATVTAPNNSVDVLTLAGNGLTISGFTLTGGRNGMYGTTANSKLTSLTVNGNAANGIQLVDADNNFLQALTVSGQAAGAGIRLSGARQNTISGNTLQGNMVNVLVEINAARQASGNIIQGNTLLDPGQWSVSVSNQALTTSVNFNVFNTATNSDKYIQNTDPAMLNAQYNWFGGESPLQGSDFSGNISTANFYATLPTVSIFPVTHYMPQNSTVNVSVMALIPNGTTVKGVDVNMAWDNDAVIGDSGDPVEGPFFSNAGSSFFEFIKPDGSSMRVNQSLLATGGVSGSLIPYVNVLFNQAFTSGAVDGTSHILLSSVQMRDASNAPITINLDPDPTPQATLIVDGSAPTVTVLLDNQTIAWTDGYLKNGDAIGITATIVESNPLTTGDITANVSGFYAAGHTADNPTTFASGTATWPTVASAVCNPENGTITVTVTATDILGNVGIGTKTIIADNMKPAHVANFRATPGHKKVNLTWDNTTGLDANLRGVQVQYTKWAGYPVYPAPEPAFPVSESDGLGAVLVTGAATTGGTHTFATDDRGIYYYRGIATDMAGNYALIDDPGNDADRSTNYILGDLGSGPGNIGSSAYDGMVNFQDLSLFSFLYFEPEANGAGWPNTADMAADFGPTTNNKTAPAGNSFGIPVPSGTVEFEDLMIFSMNYGYIAKIAAPVKGEKATTFAMNLAAAGATSGTYAVTIHLSNDGRPVKGTSVELSYDRSVLQVTGVTRGDLFGAEAQAFYGHRLGEGTVRVDAAVLGKDVEVDHSGDLATVHFKVLKQGDHALKMENVIVRNATNAAMAVEAAKAVAELPTTFDLAQNYPNPFNPSTTVKYQVPASVAVDVTVYNVLGERVVTLVNEMQQAGYYTVEWNGRDARNHTAPSGLYFCTMRAGDFSAVKKMMLMK